MEKVEKEYKNEIEANPNLHTQYILIATERYAFMRHIDPNIIKQKIDKFYEDAQKERSKTANGKSQLLERYKELRKKEYDFIEQVSNISYEGRSEDLIKLKKSGCFNRYVR